MFTPVIPSNGIVGWNFLQSTYDQQLETFSNSAQVKADNDYMVEKLSSPISVEDFLDDRRLLRTTLTSFGLDGEEWKRGFISKVLEEVVDPDSTFLTRLNNTAYTNFAEAFQPVDGQIQLTQSAISDISKRYNQKEFTIAVGEVNTNMRLNLNYQTEISELVRTDSSDEANMFRILGSVPVRTVLEQALNLPQDVRSLDLEQQAKVFQDSLQSNFRIDVSELTAEENIGRIIERFSAISAITEGPPANTPGATALALLSGIGANASQNLFLSGF